MYVFISCVRTCMHVSVCIKINTYIHTHIHTYIHTLIYIQTLIHTYIHQDIAPFLQKLAQRLGKSKQELCIWDPYYCAGKVKVHLRKLGFANVVNENEDFYALTEYPPFDVLLTSPPYSKNHIQKCMEFAVSCGKAWFILQPQYVHRKAYYAALVSQQDPLFMIPGRKYVYYAHHGGRKDNTTVICRHWARDRRCPLGDACKYFHGEEKDARAAAPALPASASSSDLVPVTPFKSIWHIHMGSAGAGAPTLNDKTFTWALQKLRMSPPSLSVTAPALPPVFANLLNTKRISTNLGHVQTLGTC